MRKCKIVQHFIMVRAQLIALYICKIPTTAGNNLPSEDLEALNICEEIDYTLHSYIFGNLRVPLRRRSAII